MRGRVCAFVLRHTHPPTHAAEKGSTPPGWKRKEAKFEMMTGSFPANAEAGSWGGEGRVVGGWVAHTGRPFLVYHYTAIIVCLWSSA